MTYFARIGAFLLHVFSGCCSPLHFIVSVFEWFPLIAKGYTLLVQGSCQDFSSKGQKICILIYIFHLISRTIEKVKNKVMVNMVIRKENFQMDEAKVKLIVCMNWIEIETRFVFFPIQYVVFLIAYQFLGDARVCPTRSRQCKQHNKFLR